MSYYLDFTVFLNTDGEGSSFCVVLCRWLSEGDKIFRQNQKG